MNISDNAAEKDVTNVKWQVKAEDGSIFGPASMASLLSWARDGRLAASHVISSDGKTWTPVTSHSELEMDWVVEISPGRFYGPIHRDAMNELISNGTLGANPARFVRMRTNDDEPSALHAANTSLTKLIESLRADFTERASILEEKLAKAEAANADLRGQLETRDLDFDAERQSFAANESKLKAELAKAAKKIENIAGQVEQSAGRDRAHVADTAKIAELEKSLAAVETAMKHLKTDFEAKSAAARAELRKSQSELVDTLSKLDLEKKRNADYKTAAERAQTLQKHCESVRKLLQQATQLLVDNSMTEPDKCGELVEDGEIVMIEQEKSIPPQHDSERVLSALEAQAMREIQQLDKQKNVFLKK